MNRHPAHQLAETVMSAAGELRGLMDPGDPFPWELTEDDHRALLQCLEPAIMALGDGIRGIAQAAGDEYVQQRLTDSYHRLVQASANIGLALSSFDYEPDHWPEEPETAAQPAAMDFVGSHSAELKAADPDGFENISGRFTEDSSPSVGPALGPPPAGSDEPPAPRARGTANSSENGPDNTKGAGGPQVHPSLDYPNPVAQGTRAGRAPLPRALVQSSLPPTRRLL